MLIVGSGVVVAAAFVAVYYATRLLLGLPL